MGGRMVGLIAGTLSGTVLGGLVVAAVCIDLEYLAGVRWCKEPLLLIPALGMPVGGLLGGLVGRRSVHSEAASADTSHALPLAQVAARVAATEHNGLWCVLAGELTFILADGSSRATRWDDAREYVQFLQYVQGQPERVHPSWEGARAFVRSQLGGCGRA